jgi:hypothetical protein
MWLIEVMLLAAAGGGVVYAVLRAVIWTTEWARKSHADGLELSVQLWLGDVLDDFSAEPWGPASDASTDDSEPVDFSDW